MGWRPGRPERQEGTILLPVILLLLLLATASASMVLQARTSLREASTRRTRVSLALAADAAVRATALALSTASAARTAAPFPVDGSSQGCRWAGDRRLLLSVQDEGGRVDLNKGTDDLLKEVLTKAGLSAPDVNALTEAILARRGPGSSGSRASRAQPAKGYTASADGFALADALDGLPGLRPGDFERLRPLFTVANGSAGIDPTVAGPAIRAIIPVRDLASPSFEPMTTPSNHDNFTIRAVMGSASGLRFAREAVLHLDAQAGPLGRFTSWEAPISYDSWVAGPDDRFCRQLGAALDPLGRR